MVSSLSQYFPVAADGRRPAVHWAVFAAQLGIVHCSLEALRRLLDAWLRNSRLKAAWFFPTSRQQFQPLFSSTMGLKIPGGHWHMNQWKALASPPVETRSGWQAEVGRWSVPRRCGSCSRRASSPTPRTWSSWRRRPKATWRSWPLPPRNPPPKRQKPGVGKGRWVVSYAFGVGWAGARRPKTRDALAFTHSSSCTPGLKADVNPPVGLDEGGCVLPAVGTTRI